MTRPLHQAEWDAVPPEDRVWRLVWSEYMPGDMAHPVIGKGLLEILDGGIHNPDTWIKAFLLLLILCGSIVVIVR